LGAYLLNLLNIRIRSQSVSGLGTFSTISGVPGLFGVLAIGGGLSIFNHFSRPALRGGFGILHGL
jgi:hypothetical protein